MLNLSAIKARLGSIPTKEKSWEKFLPDLRPAMRKLITEDVPALLAEAEQLRKEREEFLALCSLVDAATKHKDCDATIKAVQRCVQGIMKRREQ